MENILKQIEQIRKEKGIKQAVIADLLGIKQNTYSNYVCRSSDIPYLRLSRIADKLNVSVIPMFFQKTNMMELFVFHREISILIPTVVKKFHFQEVQ